MVRKLELDALKNDLSNVKGILSLRTEDDDPIGYLQFKQRENELEATINSFSSTPANKASLAMFFAGQPVQGSRGISADFAGKAVGLIQELVSKQFANIERGQMAHTGPVPLRSNSDLLLTSIARGSVGLVLEEADRNDSLTESELSVAVSRVTDDIIQTTKTDATKFDELLSEVDDRYFASLGALFKLFDDSHATVRLVEQEVDVELDSVAIHRGRERTDAAIIKDDEGVEMTGRLFLLPTTRKFELALSGQQETIHGNVSREFAIEHLEEMRTTNDIVNRDWIVKVKERTITRPGKAPQIRYTLKGLVRAISLT